MTDEQETHHIARQAAALDDPGFRRSQVDWLAANLREIISQAGDERVARLMSFARPFADALDVECDFMTPPAPFEDGFDARRRALAALAAMDTPKGGGDGR